MNALPSSAPLAKAAPPRPEPAEDVGESERCAAIIGAQDTAIEAVSRGGSELPGVPRVAPSGRAWRAGPWNRLEGIERNIWILSLSLNL